MALTCMEMNTAVVFDQFQQELLKISWLNLWKHVYLIMNVVLDSVHFCAVEHKSPMLHYVQDLHSLYLGYMLAMVGYRSDQVSESF